MFGGKGALKNTASQKHLVGATKGYREPSRLASLMLPPGAQKPLIKEYTLNNIGIPQMVQRIFLYPGILSSLGS